MSNETITILVIIAMPISYLFSLWSLYMFFKLGKEERRIKNKKGR